MTDVRALPRLQTAKCAHIGHRIGRFGILTGMSSPPSWDSLAERAHKALPSFSTLTASIHIYGPRQNDPYGEPVEWSEQVWFSAPDLWRIERNGELIVLRDATRHLTRSTPGVMAQRRGRGRYMPVDELGGLGWAHRGMFRAMSGFKKPQEPPAAVTVAGRDAWQTLLVAQERKPYSLQVAFDHATGLLLRYAAEDTAFVTEVTRLTVDEPLPPGIFGYVGPMKPARGVQPAQGKTERRTPSR